MSVNKYINGELITLANGSRTWIGDKASYEAAKQAGTLPTDCLIAITDDENEQAISGTNLLDNPWFTVNQRGQSSYNTPYSYTVDRWAMANISSVVKNADDSITISRASETGNTYIYQRYPREVGEKLNNKDVTLSVLLSNDRIFSATGKYVVGGGYNFIDKTDNESKIRLQISSPSNTTYDFVDLGINGANTSITIKAVKLELGTVSTLANDTAPNYATELLKCQRYFLRVPNTGADFATIGVGSSAANTTSANILVPTPVMMRTAPSVSSSGSFFIRGGGELITSLTIANVATYSSNGVSVVVNATGIPAKHGIALSTNNDANAYIDFSADL